MDADSCSLPLDRGTHSINFAEVIYDYKLNCSYPPSAIKNTKRVINNKAKKFHVKDGELYHLDVKKGLSWNEVSAVAFKIFFFFLFFLANFAGCEDL